MTDEIRECIGELEDFPMHVQPPAGYTPDMLIRPRNQPAIDRMRAFIDRRFPRTARREDRSA